MPRTARSAALASALALIAAAGPPAAAEDFAYTVLGPDGPVFRYVSEDPHAACASMSFVGNGTALAPMSERFRGTFREAVSFPILVCELRISYARAYQTTSAVVVTANERRDVPLPALRPQRIAVVGDTGCRVKKEKGQVVLQRCDDPAAWPFPVIASMLADRRPQLVIHVGDYIYRKAPCPPDQVAVCGGLLGGTAWDTVKAELFAPARRLMQAAPWVVPRGNHENCAHEKRLEAQGGFPFLLLLDPRPLDELADPDYVQDGGTLGQYLDFLASRQGKGSVGRSWCPEMTGAYTVPVDAGLDLWVVDSNHPEDERDAYVRPLSVDDTEEKHPLIDDMEETIDELVDQLAALSAPYGRDSIKRAWLVTHRPLYGLYPGSRKKLGEASEEPGVRPLNVGLQEAFERARIDRMGTMFDLALTGHMHVFQVVSLAEQGAARPPDITVGNSGTQLDAHFGALKALEVISQRYPVGVAGPMIDASGFTIASSFGGLLIEKTDDAWGRATLLDPRGAALATCGIRAGQGRAPATVTCEPTR